MNEEIALTHDEKIVQDIQKATDLATRNQGRIEKLEKGQEEIKELTKAVTTMATEQKHISENLAEVKSDVKQINEKPGKRWDAVVDKALLLIVAAVVAYMLSQIGL